MEIELLRCLIRHEGQAVSWKIDKDTRAIDNFIVRSRRYIERDPGRPRYLLIRGVGCRFVASPSER